MLLQQKGLNCCNLWLQVCGENFELVSIRRDFIEIKFFLMYLLDSLASISFSRYIMWWDCSQCVVKTIRNWKMRDVHCGAGTTKMGCSMVQRMEDTDPNGFPNQPCSRWSAKFSMFIASRAAEIVRQSRSQIKRQNNHVLQPRNFSYANRFLCFYYDRLVQNLYSEYKRKLLRDGQFLVIPTLHNVPIHKELVEEPLIANFWLDPFNSTCFDSTIWGGCRDVCT